MRWPTIGREEVDTVDLVYSSSWCSQHVVVRRLMPLDTSEDVEEAAEGGMTAGYEFKPDPDSILERLLPAHGSPLLFGRCSTHPLRARRTAAGDEVRHRQRRRPHHHAQPH